MLSSAMMLLIISLFSFALFVFATDPEFQLYLTRPDLRVPNFNVTIYDVDNVSPGFIFFGAYDISVHKTLCAVGAYIFDNNGDLIWSGACAFENNVIHDFKVQSYQGKDYLTFGTLARNYNHDEDNEVIGQGVLLGHNYEIEKIVKRPGLFNIHEFLIKDGKTALYIYSEKKLVSTSDFGFEGNINVLFEGFREVEMETNKILFDWFSEDYIPLDDTTIIIDEAKFKKKSEEGHPIDYGHMNSVDKFSNGDYLVSFRHMDAIYRIDGTTGDIVWQLGGKKNNFKLTGFEFMRQHDAKIMEEFGDGKYKISFFDNSAGDPRDTAVPINGHSSGRIIAIDENTMVAENVLSIANPNGVHNIAAGNVQSLPNGNYFICWGRAHVAWQSEHTSDGSLVQTTNFHPSFTYFSYKFNFTGYPLEVPMIRSFVYGSDQDSMVTAIYVSWNGATEVRSYNYYAVNGSSMSDENEENSNITRDDLKLIGNGIKDGFETLYIYHGYVPYVVAEALDSDGNPLENGQSRIGTSEVPRNWRHSGFNQGSLPEPEDFEDEDRNQKGQTENAALEIEGLASYNYFDDRHAAFILLEILGMFTMLGLVYCSIVKIFYFMRRWRSHV